MPITGRVASATMSSTELGRGGQEQSQRDQTTAAFDRHLDRVRRRLSEDEAREDIVPMAAALDMNIPLRISPRSIRLDDTSRLQELAERLTKWAGSHSLANEDRSESIDLSSDTTINIAIRDGQLDIEAVAHTVQAARWLQTSADDLRHALTRGGMNVARLSIRFEGRTEHLERATSMAIPKAPRSILTESFMEVIA